MFAQCVVYLFTYKPNPESLEPDIEVGIFRKALVIRPHIHVL